MMATMGMFYNNNDDVKDENVIMMKMMRLISCLKVSKFMFSMTI